ncbi:MAG: hypothetical protein PHX26_00060 [Proteiniphilum sp.]|nr:hypothetical protein [Proteiniphilum sp.]
MAVLLDDRPLCQIADTGGVRYRDLDIGDTARNEALDRVITSAKTVSEYMGLMESAPPLNASGLDESYKLLADFNGTVLAGHKTKQGVQFVTWDWDFNRVGVNHGHYMGENYDAAKQDFATRSGLIQKPQIFSPEQLTEIYRCIQDTLDHGYDITCEQEDMLKETQGQIEEVVPDLTERVAHAQQAEESAFSQPTM